MSSLDYRNLPAEAGGGEPVVARLLGKCEAVLALGVAGGAVPDSSHGALWCHPHSKALPVESHLVLLQGEANVV